MMWGGVSRSKGFVYLGRHSPEGMQSGEWAFKSREVGSGRPPVRAKRAACRGQGAVGVRTSCPLALGDDV